MAIPSDLDVELEMNKITLAAMGGEDALREAVKPLVELYNVKDAKTEPIDVARDMQALVVEYMSGSIDDAQRDTSIYAVLSKALGAKDKAVGEGVGDSTQVIS